MRKTVRGLWARDGVTYSRRHTSQGPPAGGARRVRCDCVKRYGATAASGHGGARSPYMVLFGHAEQPAVGLQTAAAALPFSSYERRAPPRIARRPTKRPCRAVDRRHSSCSYTAGRRRRDRSMRPHPPHFPDDWSSRRLSPRPRRAFTGYVRRHNKGCRA